MTSISSRKHVRLSFFVKLIAFCTLTLLSLEIAIRLIGTTDIDGQFYFRARPIAPFVVPLSAIKSEYQNFLEGRSRLIYNPATGYSHRPNFISADGLYIQNAQGIRTSSPDVVFSPTPSSDTLRIAIFGSSFTFGWLTTYEDGFPHLLEEELRQRGVAAEVVNFGVNGYALSQSFRQWQTMGRALNADIVIVEFRGSLIEQSTNVFRSYYAHGEPFPYSQPRYVLREGQLTLVNDPALPPEQVIETFENPSTSPIIQYENYYHAAEYNPRYLSRLWTLLTPEDTWNEATYAPETEEYQVTKALVDAFAQEVRADGAEFMLLHLITERSQQNIINGERLPYWRLMDELRSSYPFIETESAFETFSGADWIGQHYSRASALRVARLMADALQATFPLPPLPHSLS